MIKGAWGLPWQFLILAALITCGVPHRLARPLLFPGVSGGSIRVPEMRSQTDR